MTDDRDGSWVTRLCELAAEALTLRAWRNAALGVLSEAVPFDSALFHEMSPRSPLSHAALVGLSPSRIDATRGAWDDLAVELAPLRAEALSRGGVATDRDAFRGAARTRFRRLVERPFGARSLMGIHLRLDGQIISVAFLMRRNDPPFSARDRDRVLPLVPALAVCDNLHLYRAGAPLIGLRDEVRCLDDRLTPRQRQIVEHVALGHTNAEIAHALDLSPNTVRNLLARVTARLGAANRAEVVRLAVIR